MNFLKITNHPLDVNAIYSLVTDNTCGAVSLFVGTTRDNFNGQKVLSLEYEAYESMALKQLEAICVALRNRWKDVVNCAIYHRLGSVPIGEASVVIIASAPHRQSALDSVQFAIDELKSHVSIWKKEIYENSNYAWKENKESSEKSDFLSKCVVEEDDNFRSLTQINCDESTVKSRIQHFLAMKREEVNLNNIVDFSRQENFDVNQDRDLRSARTVSSILKRTDSKHYLKVRRMKNLMGPQTKLNYIGTLDKLTQSSKQKINITSSTGAKQHSFNASHYINERLNHISEYLETPNLRAKNIFKSLRDIEQRILKLESCSSEYRQLSDHLGTSVIKTIPTVKIYTTLELETKVNEILKTMEPVNIPKYT